MSNLASPSPEKLAMMRDIVFGPVDDGMIQRGVIAFREHFTRSDDNCVTNEEMEFVELMLVTTILKAALGTH